MTDQSIPVGGPSLPQRLNLVTEIPGPKSRALQARKEAAVSAGVGVMLPAYAVAAGGGVIVDVDGNSLIDFASGIAVTWALEAQQMLAEDWGVRADVWSVTSWNELRRDGLAAEEHHFLHPAEPRREPYVTRKLADAPGPIVAVTDFMKAVPDQIRQFLDRPFATLGADDFGFSDTRAAARRAFRIDAPSIVVRTLEQLADQGIVPAQAPVEAITRYDLMNIPSPVTETAAANE